MIGMLIRLEQAFIDMTQKLNKPFSPVDKEKLAEAIELNYDKIRPVMSAQESVKERSKPTVIKLGIIGSRFFAVSESVASLLAHHMLSSRNAALTSLQRPSSYQEINI